MALWSGIAKGFTVSMKAAAAISQYYAVKLGSTAGTVQMTSSQGEKAFGIALNAASAAGEAVEVLVFGICPAVITAYSGVAIGDFLTPSATTNDGKLEEAATGDYPLAQVLQAPAADGDQVMVFVNPQFAPLA